MEKNSNENNYISRIIEENPSNFETGSEKPPWSEIGKYEKDETDYKPYNEAI